LFLKPLFARKWLLIFEWFAFGKFWWCKKEYGIKNIISCLVFRIKTLKMSFFFCFPNKGLHSRRELKDFIQKNKLFSKMASYNQAYFEKTGIKVTQQASPSHGKAQDAIEKAHQLATARHPNTMAIPKIRKFIEQYPNIPVFKNYLTALLGRLKRFPELETVATECYEKHPDYLFGLINFAEILLRKKEVARAVEILGLSNKGTYFLKNKEILHESELMSYGKVAVDAAIAQNDLDEAKQQLERLWLYNDKHPIVLEQVNALVAKQLIESPLFKRAKNRRKAEFIENYCPEQITEKPVFHHSEMEALYSFDGKLPNKELFNNLLALPRETLVADLQKMLKDAVARRDVFFPVDSEEEDFEYDETSESGNQSDTVSVETNMPKHVAYFLATLNSEASLEDLLNFLRQDLEILDNWSGDIVRDFEMPVYLLGRHQLNVLQDFILQRGSNDMSRNIASHVVAQVALQEPDRREEVVEWFRKVIQTHLDHPKDNALIDSFVLTFVIGDVLKFRGVELESEIQQLFETGWINEGDFGNWNHVQKELHTEINPRYIKKIPKTIFEFYEEDPRIPSLQDKLMDEILRKPPFEQFLDSTRMGLVLKGLTAFGLGTEKEDYDPEEDEAFDEPEYVEWAKNKEEDYEDVNHSGTVHSQLITPKKSEKVGRNELCPCGSGKKYKKCHGA
jgi:SEC-C motif/Protein of unknown function (DUF1186)